MAELHGYCEALIHLHKDQEMEFYLGDVSTIMKQADADLYIKSVIVGTIRDAYGDCLIVEVNGTKILMNVWSIKLAIPYNSSVFIKDIFKDEIEGFSRKGYNN
jgi:hypothetical protein